MMWIVTLKGYIYAYFLRGDKNYTLNLGFSVNKLSLRPKTES
jgi:hypothetical protein